jgi:hypothetical protein
VRLETVRVVPSGLSAGQGDKSHGFHRMEPSLRRRARSGDLVKTLPLESYVTVEASFMRFALQSNSYFTGPSGCCCSALQPSPGSTAFQCKLDSDHANDSAACESAFRLARAESGADQRFAPGTCETAVFSDASWRILKEGPDAIFIAGDLYDGTAIDAPRSARR